MLPGILTKEELMKTKQAAAFALVAGLLTVCAPVFAHHSSAGYDLSHIVILKNAKVTSVLWANPHVVTYFDATDENGKIVHWTAEANSPENLARQGWRSGTLQAGDVIATVRIFQNKDGRPVARMGDFTLPSGKVLTSFGGADHPAPSGGGRSDCTQKTVTGGFGALDCIDKGNTQTTK